MAEYIEREKLIEDVKNDCCELVYYTKVDAIDCIKSAHAADVAPVVHGRWVYGEDVGIQCSVCGADAFTEGDYRQVKSRYCPNCGAKMDLED